MCITAEVCGCLFLSGWNRKSSLQYALFISSFVEDPFKPITWQCKPSPYKSWEYWTTCWTNNSFCSCVKTVRLGVHTSRIFVSGWFIRQDYGFATALDFYLLNTISNAWSSLYDPLHAIFLCYCPWLVPVSEMSSNYRCFRLMLDPLCLINVANHTDLTMKSTIQKVRSISLSG